jgi:hypothetical protein
MAAIQIATDKMSELEIICCKIVNLNKFTLAIGLYQQRRLLISVKNRGLQPLILNKYKWLSVNKRFIYNDFKAQCYK